MNKLISIILPCYKAEKFIGNIINDVTNQTYQDWELLVISNGEGQDSQLSIIDGFRKIDNRIKLFSIPTGGVSLARNIGLQNAVGDWITFLDADDAASSELPSVLLCHFVFSFLCLNPQMSLGTNCPQA